MSGSASDEELVLVVVKVGLSAVLERDGSLAFDVELASRGEERVVAAIGSLVFVKMAVSLEAVDGEFGGD